MYVISDLEPLDRVIALAAAQRGFFTAAQAVDAGMGRNSLSYWSGQGRFVKVQRGVYRLVGFGDEQPSDHIYPYWLAFGSEAAVSHESALELHNLSNVISSAIHLIVPRQLRSRTPPPGTKIHTVKKDLSPREVTHIDGLPVTTVERTIVDSAAGVTQPDQIELACQDAIKQGITTAALLINAAKARGGNAEKLISRILKEINEASS